MKKLIFKKIIIDTGTFFFISIISVATIVWIIQAVNYLDLISEDGHSLKVYFSYTLFSLPKIISKILPFIFMISIFYILIKYEVNNELIILDMGTGAGLPGLILSIMGCHNVTLVDSNNKKTKFLEKIKKEMNLKVKIILDRVENEENKKYDIITSRALANLSKLFTYSHNFLKKNTVLIFLKGKTVNDEILDATKIWKFEYQKHVSLSDKGGNLLVIRNLKKL